jgi:hypothetical protein
MKMFIVMVALLLFTAGGFAADNDTGKKSQQSPEAGDVRKSTGRKIVKDKKTPQWPRPYKSTEEISVDSTVPFPTDI